MISAMPLGQLPVLQTEYGSIVQTTAIANYAAKKLGKYLGTYN